MNIQCRKLVVLSSFLFSTIAAGSTLEIDAAKKFAIANNYLIRSMESRLSSARATRNEARSSYFPELGIAIGSRYDAMGDQSESTSLGYGYVRWNIFNGFLDSYSSDISASEFGLAEIELRRAEFLVGLDVEEQFNLYLYFRDLLNLSDEAIALNAKHIKLVSKTRSMGQVSKADAMEFSIKESDLRSERLQYQQGLEKARVQLKRLLGEEVGAKIEPVGKLQHQHIEGDLMEYLDKIKKNSITVQTAAKNSEIATLESKKWRAEWLPKLDFEAQIGRLDSDGISEDSATDDTAVLMKLTASINLFSGLKTRWRRQKTLAQRQSKQYLLKNEILIAITKMEENYRELKSIELQVDLEVKNERLRSKYYKAVLAEYQRGYKNSADLLEASEKLIGSKNKQLAFRLRFLQKRIEFEKFYGGDVNISVAHK